MRAVLPVLVPTLLVTGCSGGDERVAVTSTRSTSTPATSTPATSTPASAGTELVVEVVPSPGAEARTWTLTCEPAGGSHPDPQAACDVLARTPDPLAPVPADAVCTQVVGGPQTAVVRGTVDGGELEVGLSRTDGCRTGQWDRLGAVLPAGGS